MRTKNNPQRVSYPPPSGPPVPLLSATIFPAPKTETESAWERGLRQARELVKKSAEKKDQEPDFEKKRECTVAFRDATPERASLGLHLGPSDEADLQKSESRESSSPGGSSFNAGSRVQRRIPSLIDTIRDGTLAPPIEYSTSAYRRQTRGKLF